MFLMQGINPNSHTYPNFEQSQTMNGDGAPEFAVDPALYFPTANNFGYYYSGSESPSEWNDHLTVVSLDGADVQYAGGQSDNLPYVYYTPTYGYGESPFNPYNPYIPGAMIGVDGSYVGTQYYALSPYQNSVSSSSYFPVPVQTKPEAAASSSVDPLFDTASVRNRVTSESKRLQSSSSVPFTKNATKAGTSHSQSLMKISEGSRANSGTSHRSNVYRNNGAGNQVPSSSVPQAHAQPQGFNDSTFNRRDFSKQNQIKVPVHINGAFSESGSNSHGNSVGDGSWAKFYQRRPGDDTNKGPDLLAEQNRGPRISRSKNQFVVKAYTKKAGDFDPQGNIIISADDYNKDDFLLDYVHAKFFVIKSYSEDDVHKSIKYNVWSSTLNGNKKLNSAYEDAQRIASGKPSVCPIFLYFSVNASGQFCGVAEMVGPVDFQKDMDFWQQDKWSGSFPVKWHMIKDVPNMSFRHIILENNEYKPVTNSRDTQEIKYKPGMEMLKMFKNFTSKTSLLDDFMYYENRQKIMLEERARLLPKTIVSVQPMSEISSSELATKGTEQTHTSALGGSNSSTDGGSAKKKNKFEANSSDVVSTLKIGSLTINPKQTDSKSMVVAMPTPLAATKVASGVADIVTVGSMPVKVNGHDNSNSKTPSGLLTVGTIPIDPKALRMERADVAGKGGSVSK
ncbi:hypothetical protein V2J09_013391 [Rumex salicifolius]